MPYTRNPPPGYDFCTRELALITVDGITYCNSYAQFVFTTTGVDINPGKGPDICQPPYCYPCANDPTGLGTEASMGVRQQQYCDKSTGICATLWICLPIVANCGSDYYCNCTGSCLTIGFRPQDFARQTQYLRLSDFNLPIFNGSVNFNEKGIMNSCCLRGRCTNEYECYSDCLYPTVGENANDGNCDINNRVRKLHNGTTCVRQCNTGFVVGTGSFRDKSFQSIPLGLSITCMNNRINYYNENAQCVVAIAGKKCGVVQYYRNQRNECREEEEAFQLFDPNTVLNDNITPWKNWNMVYHNYVSLPFDANYATNYETDYSHPLPTTKNDLLTHCNTVCNSNTNVKIAYGCGDANGRAGTCGCQKQSKDGFGRWIENTGHSVYYKDTYYCIDNRVR